ncbi:MAG: methionine--tRNA ligase [Nanoarchaeota archaeon]
MGKKFYITTAIDYANALPHIGHSYQKIMADCLARWHKSAGFDTFFLMGTDEHGQKIQKYADAAGKEPKEFVDGLVKSFQENWKALNIKYDIFYRTTSEQHRKSVNEFTKKIKKDIYKGYYEGLYCVGCETFYTEKDLIDGKICPTHKKEAELIKEESYFFKLSKYQNKLLELYKKNPKFISPENRKDEIINRVKEGLKDLSISRKSVSWGIPFPLDSKHTTYVWFEALQCYISGIGWPAGNFRRYWPADIQLLGKDNAWFHTVIWPALLLSARLKLPKKIFIHGFVSINGQKISKSLGNAIEPKVFAEKYGADALRYMLMREINPKEDGDFSEKVLVERLNSDLADNLGNLVSRSLTLIEKFSGSVVPKGKPDANLKKEFTKTFKDVKKDIDAVELHHALEKIFSFISLCNKYVNDEAPWELAKTDDRRLRTVLYNLAESLRVISALVHPFIPESGEKIVTQLGITLPQLNDLKYGENLEGTKISKGEILFKKVERFTPEVFGAKEIFSKVNLRVAEIKSAEAVLDSDKLVKLQLDVGELGSRQIVAGIRKHYSPNELVGKKIIIVANLKPVKLRGVDSNGMLLAAEDESHNLEVLSPVGNNGEQAIADGIKFEKAGQIEIPELEMLSLKVEHGRLVSNGKVFKTSKGEIKTKIVSKGCVR